MLLRGVRRGTYTINDTKGHWRRLSTKERLTNASRNKAGSWCWLMCCCGGARPGIISCGSSHPRLECNMFHYGMKYAMFASLLSLVADSVTLLLRLGATPPPRSLWAWSMRIPLACCLSCVVDVDLPLFFLLFLPFFDFNLGIVCFHPVFFLWVLCCLLGFAFCCDSFSIWYVSYTYVRWSHLFIFVWGRLYDLF